MKTITLTEREYEILIATVKMGRWVQANARGHCIGSSRNPDYVLAVETEMFPRDGVVQYPTTNEMSSLLERLLMSVQ